MEINDYQKSAMRTLNPEISSEDLLLNSVMGLCGESGEAIDLIKKNRFHGHPLASDQLIAELGDIAWYLAEAATALNLPLETIFQHNLEKLKKRYPEGFQVEASLHRNA